MSYTGAEVIALAQKLLIDSDDDAYGDDVIGYLNEGCRRFAKSTHCCQAAVDVSVSSNTIAFSDIQTSISGALDVLLPVKILLKSGTNYPFLHKAPLYELKDLLASSSTTPTRWTIFGEKIFFDLSPSSSPDFDVTVFTSYVPEDIEEGDNILIPDMWVEAIVKYIEYCCRVSDRDAGLANGAFSDFENIVATANQYYMSQME